MTQFRVAALYKFTPLVADKALQDRLLTACREQDVYGTLLIGRWKRSIESYYCNHKAAKPARNRKAEFDHPPVDGAEDAFPTFPGIELVYVNHICGHGHHDGKQTADSERKEGQSK